MKNAHLFLLLFISSQIQAFEKPAHCEAYDSVYSIREGNALRSDGTAFSSDDVVSSTCSANGELLDIEVGDLVNSWSKVNDSFLDQRSALYQIRATRFAMEKLKERAGEFEGLAGAKGKDYSPELVSCLNRLEPDFATKLNNDRTSEATTNQPLTDSFIQTSFDKAMLSSSVLSVIEKKKDNHEKELKDLKSQKSSLGKDAYNEKKQELENKFQLTLNKYSGIVKQMSQTDPLLFSSENNFSVWDWFNSQVIPSDLSNELLGDVPESIQSKLEDSLSDEDNLQGLTSFVQVYAGELKDEIGAYKARQIESNKNEINKKIREGATEFVDGVHDSMAVNCANNGETLHFNNQIIAGLAESLYGESDLSPEQKKEEMIALQAWHCHAWRQRPYEAAGGLNWKKATGIATLVAGGAMWLTAPLTGIGAIAGTYMMAAGGGILAASEVQDYFKHDINLKQEQTGFNMGWRDLASLSKAQDQRTDIVTAVGMDVAFGGVGVAARLVRLPKFMQTGRVAQNNGVREGASPAEDVENYYSLIMNRHERVIPSPSISDRAHTPIRALNGNTTIPKRLLDDPDFAPMLRIITDTKGKAVDRDLAFADLQAKIKTFKSYPDEIRQAVRSGINLRQMEQANKTYSNILKPSHFSTNGGPIGDLPKIDPPFSISASPNNTVVLGYRVVNKGEDGTETIVDFTKDFPTHADFKKFVTDTRNGHKQAFSFDIKDESLRRSGIFDVLDRQPKLYEELKEVRQGLINAGENVDLKTGKYANLTDRQNGYIFQLNQILNDSPDLLPRRDAMRAFRGQINKAERRALYAGQVFRGRGGKYSQEAQSFAQEGLPSVARRLAPIGILGGTFGGTGIVVTSMSDRLGVRGLREDYLDAMRGINRGINKVFYPEAPVSFTNAEMACAKEARAWSVENACLLTLLNSQVMVREGIREQFDPNYDMSTDQEMLRRVRQYIRDFYRLREFFAEGEKTQIAQRSMREVAKEKSEADLKEFIREVALKNGLVILDRGVLSEDVSDRLRQRLNNYNNNPEDARQAYEDLLEAFAAYQGQVIQNPELPSNIQTMVEKLMTEELIDGLKADK